MRITDLPSPGILNQSIRLRQDCANAISAVQINADRSVGGKTPSANKLHTFFSACVTALAGLRDTTAPGAPSAINHLTGGGTLVIVTYAEGLDPTIVPAASAFTFVSAKTISNIEVRGNTVRITTTANVVNGNTLAYTQPGTNALRDVAGNLVPSFTATNSIGIAGVA